MLLSAQDSNCIARNVSFGRYSTCERGWLDLIIRKSISIIYFPTQNYVDYPKYPPRPEKKSGKASVHQAIIVMSLSALSAQTRKYKLLNGIVCLLCNIYS